MRFYVEQAPNWSWRVMLEGADAPVSEHDTEEEARERLAAYLRGMATAAAPTAEAGRARGDRVRLRDGSEVVVRPLEPEDEALLPEGFTRMGALIGVDHADREAIGAIDPATGLAIGVARFVRARPGATTDDVAVAVVGEWQGRGLGWALLERLAGRAAALGVTDFARHDGGSTARLTVPLAVGRPDRLHDALRAAAAGEAGS